MEHGCLTIDAKEIPLAFIMRSEIIKQMRKLFFEEKIKADNLIGSRKSSKHFERVTINVGASTLDQENTINIRGRQGSRIVRVTAEDEIDCDIFSKEETKNKEYDDLQDEEGHLESQMNDNEDEESDRKERRRNRVSRDFIEDEKLKKLSERKSVFVPLTYFEKNKDEKIGYSGEEDDESEYEEEDVKATDEK